HQGDARARLHAPGGRRQLVGAPAAAAGLRPLGHPRGRVAGCRRPTPATGARARGRRAMRAAPASATTRRRARRGEGPRLREELLAATERLLAETGDEEAVSIRAIADAVGVTP